MKTFIKYFSLLLFFVFICIFAYYANEILQARNYTQNVIIPDLEEGKWRQPGGPVHAFDLTAKDLSERQKEILIKVQDPGFYGHHGVDLSTPGAGLTTITQAVVKKLYFEDFKPGFAKIEQSLIAFFVTDGMISKEDQLTYFINLMYFGNIDERGIVGIGAAARAYYNKDVSELTEDEYISLMAMIVMPATFGIVDHPDWNKDRVNRIEALLAGEYVPKDLMDQFYGRLPQEVIENGLPAGSYFGEALKPPDTAKE